MTDLPIIHPPRSRFADRRLPASGARPMITTGRRTRRVNKKRRLGLSAWLPTGFHPWLSTFVLATFLFQVLLVPQALFPIRTLLRIASFASSLVMLLLVPGGFKWSPMTHFSIVLTALLLIQLGNPNNNSILSACAAIGLNFAIISPVFWVPRLKLSFEHIRFIFFMFWAFHSASSCLGTLEVYMPGTFSRESQVTTSLGGDIAGEALKVTLADGTSVYRPMGLTDSPGGAAVSGYIVMLTATGLLMTRVSVLIRIALIVSIVGGVFCIYLSQVRSILIIALFCQIAMFAVVIIRGELNRLGTMIFIVPASIAAATLWAFAIGGEQVSNRFGTLTESSFGAVYYENRGNFLEETVFRTAPEYPLGAGLGRWGMIYAYFGDKSSSASSSIWAEIQPTAWIYDGGVLFAMVYYSALGFCIVNAFKLALRRQDKVSEMATIVFAWNVATLATTFGSIPFIGNSGLSFWLMNATLVVVSNKKMLSKLSKSQRSNLMTKVAGNPAGSI